MSRDTLRDCNHGEVETYVGRGVMCRKCGEWATFKGRAALEAEPVGLDDDTLPVPPYHDDRGDLQEAWMRGFRAALKAERDDAFVCPTCGSAFCIGRLSYEECAALEAEPVGLDVSRDTLRGALVEAMQEFQDKTFLDENNHRYHCGGSEANRLLDYLGPALVRHGLVLRAALEAEPVGLDVERLADALNRCRNDLLAYGVHLTDRPRPSPGEHRPAGELCRCGLDEAVARASLALGNEPQSHREGLVAAALHETPE